MKERLILLLLFVFLLFVFLRSEEIHPRVIKVIEKLEKSGFSRSEIEKIFHDPRLTVYSDIPALKKRKINYFEAVYKLFSPESIARGRNFLAQHRKILEKAENQFQVPKEIIVAILRLETNCGEFVGNRRLLNTFYSMLVMNFQADFAEKELINLFLIAKENNKDPFDYFGSYMGAFGLCQFLPSSYLRYAIDGNGDGKKDLDNVEDAIASVANYLQAHGWRPDDFYQQKDALYAYNHDLMYVFAIFIYAYFLKGG